jgi:hypothetical protein
MHLFTVWGYTKAIYNLEIRSWDRTHTPYCYPHFWVDIHILSATSCLHMLYIACNIDNLKARHSLAIPIVSFNCQHTPIIEHRAGDLRYGVLKVFPMVVSVSRLDRRLTEWSRDTKDSQNYSQCRLSCRSLDTVQFWAAFIVSSNIWGRKVGDRGQSTLLQD